MNSSDGFQINDEEVRKKFEELEPKKQKTAFKGALKESAKILQKEAKKSLKRKIGTKKANSKNWWNEKKLSSGIVVSADKYNQGNKYIVEDKYFSKVHIMGDFRLKFFEKGTSERSWKRHTNKDGSIGKGTGKMTGTYFFKEANEAKGEEAMKSLDKNLDKIINKILARKK